MKKFYRSKTDRFIAGVCGGLGRYFEIDSMIIRGLFVLVACMGGVGAVVYIVLAILAPEEDDQSMHPPEPSSAPLETPVHVETPPIGPRNKRRMFALFLFFLGLLMLLDALLPFAWLNWTIFGPLALMFLGGYIFILQK